MRAAFASDPIVYVAFMKAMITTLNPGSRLINEPVAAFGSPAILAARSRGMLDVLLEAGADINLKSDWWAGGLSSGSHGVDCQLTRGMRNGNAESSARKSDENQPIALSEQSHGMPIPSTPRGRYRSPRSTPLTTYSTNPTAIHAKANPSGIVMNDQKPTVIGIE